MECLCFSYCLCSIKVEIKGEEEAEKINICRKEVFLVIVSLRWKIEYVRKQNKKELASKIIIEIRIFALN
jgi:hypothetical protein